MPEIDLETVLQIARQLPGFPQATNRALRIIDDPMGSIPDLAQAIGLDQTLAARVLRWANSPFYGLRCHVSTLEQAIMVLGTVTIRDLLLIASASKMLGGEMTAYGLESGELWRHSVAVAAGSRWLATIHEYPRPDQLFVAGLLHDIGKLVFNELLRHEAAWRAEWFHRRGQGITFMDLERWLVGLNHAQLGERIAGQWNLPSILREAIAYHHEPGVATIAAIDPRAIDWLHQANMAAHTLDIGAGNGRFSDGPNEEAPVISNLRSSDLETLLQIEVAAVSEIESMLDQTTSF